MKWTREKVIKYWKKYKYAVDMAPHMKVTRERVRQLLRLFHIPYDKKPRQSYARLKTKEFLNYRNYRIIIDYKRGYTIDQLCEKYHLGKDTIKRLAREARKQLRKKRNNQIRELYNNGKSQKEIAQLYKLNQSQISNILRSHE